MCYYNSIKIEKGTKISIKGKIKELPEIDRPLQSGFEYGNWPIVKLANDDIDLELAHWELIAPWVKCTLDVMKGREKFNTLNATSKRLLESKLFKQPALKRRCLVLSSGFYEWRHFKPAVASKEIAYPYFVSLKDRPYFLMAGIYQPWVDVETGEAMNTFSIVTTHANPFMEQIHNKKKRMPTIFNEQQASQWLDPNLPEADILALAQTQYDPALMKAYTIQKQFRNAQAPHEAFQYEGLPELIQ
jgi:putative SOS response-associated peptidase YedK